MIITQEQNVGLQKFLQFIQNTLLPFDKQETVKQDRFWWCYDWWCIEILKYLINEDRLYQLDTPPHRLRNNPFFNKAEITKQAHYKLAMLASLDKVKELASVLCVCESGRGIDIVLANMIKKWDTISCYDSVEFYQKLLLRSFPDKTTVNIIDYATFNFNSIKEKVVLIADSDKIPKTSGMQMLNNKNIVAIIRRGVIIDNIENW